MRIPLVPDSLNKGRWNLKNLNDSEVEQLVHGKPVKGHVNGHAHVAEDVDFAMPIIRRYIKDFKIPVRRFNMNVSIANVDVTLEGASDSFKGIFVRDEEKELLIGTDGQWKDKSLDEGAKEYFFQHYQSITNPDDKLTKNYKRMKDNNLSFHKMFDEDVTDPVIATITGGKKIDGHHYLDLIDLKSWNKF